MAEVENNFKDPKTGKEFWFQSYKVTIRGDKKVYLDGKKEIVNPETGTVLIPIEREKNYDTDSPPIGKFSSMSRENRSKSLKKRAKDHAKKHVINDKDINYLGKK